MEVETLLNEKIPSDIVAILKECGFDSYLPFLSITNETINDIEEYVKEDTSILKNTSYEGVKHFKFKPGHKIFLLNLTDRINYLKETKPNEKMQCKLSDFSYILRTFIETAETNFGKHPKGFRYNETNRFFSIFIYLMCGKACYETLSANLPIPKANTICKCNSDLSVNV